MDATSEGRSMGVAGKPCPHCGRTDVPICARCGFRAPHGYTVGTWLPCPCEEPAPPPVAAPARRRAIVQFPREEFARRLGLPEGTEVVDVSGGSFAYDGGPIQVKVEHPSLPAVVEGLPLHVDTIERGADGRPAYGLAVFP